MRKFGLLGEKLEHSFSPQIHAMLADYEYKLYEKSPDEVGEFLRSGDFDGLNVTIPYKKTALTLCDSLSDAAVRIGCVNTIIRRDDGALYGDNTDYFGFSYMLVKSGADVRGKKALVLGDGGAAATVRAVLADAGASMVVTISRRGPDNYDNISKNTDASIIVNTTPVGMFPGNGASPVDPGLFTSCEAILDVIYNPAKTELMLLAEDMGIPCTGGLVMLAAQAKRAGGLFLGMDRNNCFPETKTPERDSPFPPDREGTGSFVSEIDGIADMLARKMMNIALIGMPGSGKTTVGKALALLTGRKFFDLDELIVSRAGKSIEAVFNDDGETVFRDLEEDVLREVSKEHGSVIATGGGVVTRPVNRRLLRQNSVVVFLDRDPGELPADGRPLSLSLGVSALYSERLPLYREWSDNIITARCGVDETAQAVREILKL